MRREVFALLAFSVFGLNDASACTFSNALNLNAIADAPSVASVSIQAYTAKEIPLGEAQKVLRSAIAKHEVLAVPKYALLELRVLETLHGTELPEKITAIWRWSTFSMAQSWNGPREILVGIERVETSTGQIFSIVQQGCAPLSYLSDIPENRKKLFGD